MPSTKIKVRVEDLIQGVEAARQEKLDRHAKRQAERQAKLVRAREVALTAIGDIEVDELEPLWHGGGRQRHYLRFPVKERVFEMVSILREVVGEPDVRQEDRDLALLRMSTDSIITVGVDSNWARYL